MKTTAADQRKVFSRDSQLAEPDFFLATADSIVNHGSSIKSLALTLPMYASQSNFGFRYNPLYGELAGMDFLTKPIKARRAHLAVANCGVVHGLSFKQQQALLPKDLRPITAIEAVATLMAYHHEHKSRPNDFNYPPELEYVWFWCDDIIPLGAWPKWYRDFRGISSDHRVAIRVDQKNGLILGHFPAESHKVFVDWVTPDSESYRTIALAATLA